MVADVRTAVRSSHREALEQFAYRLRRHLATAISVDGKGSGRNLMICDHLLDEALGDRCVYAAHQCPPYDHAAEDIERD